MTTDDRKKPRHRTTVAEMNRLMKWCRKNPSATVQEFVQQAGGKEAQFQYVRFRAGIRGRGRKIVKASVEATAKQVLKKTVEEFAKPSPTEIVVEGVTPDFIWYEIDLLQRRLGEISSRFAHVMKVYQGRDAEQKKMLHEVIRENSALHSERLGLKQQVAELTEMINGTPV